MGPSPQSKLECNLLSRSSTRNLQRAAEGSSPPQLRETILLNSCPDGQCAPSTVRRSPYWKSTRHGQSAIIHRVVQQMARTCVWSALSRNIRPSSCTRRREQISGCVFRACSSTAVASGLSPEREKEIQKYFLSRNARRIWTGRCRRGITAYESLLAKLADVPPPSGKTPRQIGRGLVPITSLRPDPTW